MLDVSCPPVMFSVLQELVVFSKELICILWADAGPEPPALTPDDAPVHLLPWRT